MGKKSRLKMLGQTLKQRVKNSTKTVVALTKVKGAVKKLRWTSDGVASEMLNGLKEKSKWYQNLTIEQKQEVARIVHEESSKQLEYKAKEFYQLAKRIDKRFKREIK